LLVEQAIPLAAVYSFARDAEPVAIAGGSIGHW
jgi:hypothetical protein